MNRATMRADSGRNGQLDIRCIIGGTGECRENAEHAGHKTCFGTPLLLWAQRPAAESASFGPCRCREPGSAAHMAFSLCETRTRLRAEAGQHRTAL